MMNSFIHRTTISALTMLIYSYSLAQVSEANPYVSPSAILMQDTAIPGSESETDSLAPITRPDSGALVEPEVTFDEKDLSIDADRNSRSPPWRSPQFPTCMPSDPNCSERLFPSCSPSDTECLLNQDSSGNPVMPR